MSKPTSRLEDLPDEIVRKIITHLPIEQFYLFATTNRKYRDICRDWFPSNYEHKFVMNWLQEKYDIAHTMTFLLKFLHNNLTETTTNLLLQSTVGENVLSYRIKRLKLYPERLFALACACGFKDDAQEIARIYDITMLQISGAISQACYCGKKDVYDWLQQIVTKCWGSDGITNIGYQDYTKQFRIINRGDNYEFVKWFESEHKDIWNISNVKRILFYACTSGNIKILENAISHCETIDEKSAQACLKLARTSENLECFKRVEQLCLDNGHVMCLDDIFRLCFDFQFPTKSFAIITYLLEKLFDELNETIQEERCRVITLVSNGIKRLMRSVNNNLIPILTRVLAKYDTNDLLEFVQIVAKYDSKRVNMTIVALSKFCSCETNEPFYRVVFSNSRVLNNVVRIIIRNAMCDYSLGKVHLDTNQIRNMIIASIKYGKANIIHDAIKKQNYIYSNKHGRALNGYNFDTYITIFVEYGDIIHFSEVVDYLFNGVDGSDYYIPIMINAMCNGTFFDEKFDIMTNYVKSCNQRIRNVVIEELIKHHRFSEVTKINKMSIGRTAYPMKPLSDSMMRGDFFVTDWIIKEFGFPTSTKIKSPCLDIGTMSVPNIYNKIGIINYYFEPKIIKLLTKNVPLHKIYMNNIIHEFASDKFQIQRYIGQIPVQLMCMIRKYQRQEKNLSEKCDIHLFSQALNDACPDDGVEGQNEPYRIAHFIHLCVDNGVFDLLEKTGSVFDWRSLNALCVIAEHTWDHKLANTLGKVKMLNPTPLQKTMDVISKQNIAYY